VESEHNGALPLSPRCKGRLRCDGLRHSSLIPLGGMHACLFVGVGPMDYLTARCFVYPSKHSRIFCEGSRRSVVSAHRRAYRHFCLRIFYWPLHRQGHSWVVAYAPCQQAACLLAWSCLVQRSAPHVRICCIAVVGSTALEAIQLGAVQAMPSQLLGVASSPLHTWWCSIV
jgi:hypothetical protein